MSTMTEQETTDFRQKCVDFMDTYAAKTGKAMPGLDDQKAFLAAAAGAGLAGILGQSGSQNTHHEDQQKLDVFADNTFMRILTAGKSVAGIGSEEQDDYILCHDQGK